jgi:hypothetical protein
MEEQQITIIAKAENGKISIHTEIPAPGDDETYVVTIGVVPQSTMDTAAQRQVLDALYGALADIPLREIDRV